MQEKYALFFILALLAEILGTLSGFGSSILFVPLASLFLDFKIVLGITAVFHVFSNLSKIYLFQKGIDKKIALKLGIPAVISVIIGALLTHYIPQKQTEIGMNSVGVPNLLPGYLTSSSVYSNTFTYSGGVIPAGTYRVYTTAPNEIFRLTNTYDIYFKGNDVQP